jgi:hypothetical protein
MKNNKPRSKNGKFTRPSLTPRLKATPKSRLSMKKAKTICIQPIVSHQSTSKTPSLARSQKQERFRNVCRFKIQSEFERMSEL